MLKVLRRLALGIVVLAVAGAGLLVASDIVNERAAQKCEDSGYFAERHGGSGDFVACLPEKFRPKP